MPSTRERRSEERELGQTTERRSNSIPRRSGKAVRKDQDVEVTPGCFGDDDGRHVSQIIQRQDATGANVREPILRAVEGARNGVEESGDAGGIRVGLI